MGAPLVPAPRILVVDDDDTFRALLAAELRSRGLATTPAESAAAALALVEKEEFEVALIDLRLPDGDGLELMRRVRELSPTTETIVLTGHGTIDTAIEAMRRGAYDYLRKPCPIEELEVTIQKALERRGLIERNRILSQGMSGPDPGATFVGASPAFRELCALIDRVAVADSTVLVLGETGVGKDVVARLIHARSARREQPFVVLECAALQEELLNSELFGHEKGAYTGAGQGKPGLFEVANGGTIFLDEVGDVSLATQVKLLRVLETGTFRHVGGTREIRVDVRVIAATNRNLAELMERGFFRRDLFYRMSTIRIEIPPLRDRPADIPVLAEYFLQQLNARFGQHRRLTREALRCLERHGWPGNVRELLHVV